MYTYYDIIISILIIISTYPAVIFLYSIYRRPQSLEAKHKKTFLSISIILLLATATLVWGSFVEPRILVINRQEIDLEKIEKPIKIALVADIHLGPYKKADWVEKIIAKIKIEKPDIVFIAGDHIYNSEYKAEEIDYLEPLKNLTKEIPTYAIQGNHEYGIGDGSSNYKNPIINAHWSKEIKTKMESLGVHYMTNELEKLNINGQEFYLFGGDSILADKLKFDSLTDRDENLATIAMIHNPIYLFTTDYPRINLTLSGHTHGGQIRLPIFGPIGRVDSLIPANFYEGLNQLQNGDKIFVTSGAGESGPRARLFNPPEIVILTIK